MANSKLVRYEGAMLGVAIGDALGAPLEFTGLCGKCSAAAG